MSQFPVIPPDPTPEEVARTRAALEAAGQLGDWIAENVDLTPKQRRSLNAGTRSGRRGLDLVENMEQQLGIEPGTVEPGVDVLDLIFGPDPG